MKRIKFLLLSFIFIAVVAFGISGAWALGARVPVIGNTDSELKATSSVSGAYPLPNQTPAPTPAPTPGAGPAQAFTSVPVQASAPSPTPSAGPAKPPVFYDEYNSYDGYTAYDYFSTYALPSGPAATPVPTPASGDAPGNQTAPASASNSVPASSTQQTALEDGAVAASNAVSSSEAAPGGAISTDNSGGAGEEQLLAHMIWLIGSYKTAIEEGVGEQPEAPTGAADTPASTATDASGGSGASEASDASDTLAPILINITNPNGDDAEVVYKNTYSICGVRDDDADPEEPIIVFIARYDAETGEYAGFTDIDGEGRWTVGANGVFTRSILLEEGENQFAIAACTAGAIEAAQTEGRLIRADELQIIKFTILYRSQNVAEKISELFKELTIENILKEIDNH